MRTVRWILFLPGAFAASVIAGAIGNLFGQLLAWLMPFVSPTEVLGWVVSGGFSAVALMMVGARIAPEVTERVKWVLVGTTCLFGLAAFLGGFVEGGDETASIAGAVMILLAMMCTRLPASAFKMRQSGEGQEQGARTNSRQADESSPSEAHSSQVVAEFDPLHQLLSYEQRREVVEENLSAFQASKFRVLHTKLVMQLGSSVQPNLDTAKRTAGGRFEFAVTTAPDEGDEKGAARTFWVRILPGEERVQVKDEEQGSASWVLAIGDDGFRVGDSVGEGKSKGMDVEAAAEEIADRILRFIDSRGPAN